MLLYPKAITIKLTVQTLEILIAKLGASPIQIIIINT